MFRLAGYFAVGAFSLSCAGVAPERVDAIEKKLKMMEGRGGGGQDDSRIEAMEQRFAGFEATTTASIRTAEEVIEVLQREVSAMANPAQSAPGDPIWSDATTALGLSPAGISADGDSYTIKRAWLAHQLRAMAITGKPPKLAAGKKGGVSIKGVRPNTLPDQLGFKNGDTIVTIGETEVSSPEAALQALQKAPNPVTVKIMRKKKEVTLQYTVANE